MHGRGSNDSAVTTVRVGIHGFCGPGIDSACTREWAWRQGGNDRRIAWHQRGWQGRRPAGDRETEDGPVPDEIIGHGSGGWGIFLQVRSWFAGGKFAQVGSWG